MRNIAVSVISAASDKISGVELVLGHAGPEGLLITAGFKSSVVISMVTGEIFRDLIVEGKTFCNLSRYLP